MAKFTVSEAYKLVTTGAWSKQEFEAWVDDIQDVAFVEGIAFQRDSDAKLQGLAECH